MPIISVTLPSDGTTADVADYNSVVTAMLATINGLLDDDNIASMNGSKIVAGSLPVTAFDTTTKAGYISGLAAPNTITYNGNRSFTLVFNSNDLTDELSDGMRLRLTRTVAAPTQLTVLGGTKYWSKASPNKFAWTDDFLIDVEIAPTSYTLGTIASCYNGTSGWALRMTATGQIELIGYNAAAANFSRVLSNQSVRLNRSTRITAQLDMSGFTNSSTTSYVMFDGVNITSVVSRGGTNPTALIQAGNFNAGAENGGTNPFQGSISQLAIFNAKITQATILTYHGQGYAGTETSLASAWSFNGVATDLNTTTPNDLTAQNSAAYATGGPFGNAGISSTLEYCVIHSRTFSTNTTLVVQVPEGCSIPTSGGITAVAYSGHDTPYGFPSKEERWQIAALFKVTATQAAPTASVWYNPNSNQVSLPIGVWDTGYQGSFLNSGAATISELFTTLSTGAASESDTEFTTYALNIMSAGTPNMVWPQTRFKTIAASVITPYFLNFKSNNAGTIGVSGSGAALLLARNTYIK